MIKSFFGFTFENLETFLIKNNLNKNNAISLFNFFFKNYNFIDEINHIENVSKKTIEIINKKLKFVLLKIIKKSTDNNGKTIKFLLELFDKECIETVLMKFDYGYSICVSTQVGCNMGCKFCASGLIKKIRNLTTEEIVLQIITIQQEFLKDEKIKNVVFMGIGEPFDNYKNVVNAIKIITNHFGLGIAERKITVSTSGIVPKIIKFAKEQPKISLAISLHASTDKIRNKIMPINYLWNIKKLFNAIKKYLKIATNKRITIEYLLLKNINDSINDAIMLAKLVKNMHCIVDLILYNKVEEHTFERSNNAHLFAETLIKNNVNVVTRIEYGKKISAACGQLRCKRILNKKIN